MAVECGSDLLTAQLVSVSLFQSFYWPSSKAGKENNPFVFDVFFQDLALKGKGKFNSVGWPGSVST